MRNGEKQTQVDKVDASQLAKDVFGSNKIRKAIALAVYPATKDYYKINIKIIIIVVI